MKYYYLRKLVTWFSKINKLQCSGKRRNQCAYEWCQFYLGHSGVCKTWSGEEFSI